MSERVFLNIIPINIECIGVIIIKTNSILDTVQANATKTKENQYEKIRSQTLLNIVNQIHMAYYKHLFIIKYSTGTVRYATGTLALSICEHIH